MHRTQLFSTASFACILSVFFFTSANEISSQEFWWLKGDSTAKRPPVYGQKGKSHPANTPGARNYPVVWQDTAGNVWLFGGTGRWGAFSTGLLNDIWK